MPSLNQLNNLAEIARMNLKPITETHSYAGTKTVVFIEDNYVFTPHAYSGAMLVGVSRQLNGKIGLLHGTWSFQVDNLIV